MVFLSSFITCLALLLQTGSGSPPCPNHSAQMIVWQTNQTIFEHDIIECPGELPISPTGVFTSARETACEGEDTTGSNDKDALAQFEISVCSLPFPHVRLQPQPIFGSAFASHPFQVLRC